jgi:hypothetical protein
MSTMYPPARRSDHIEVYKSASAGDVRVPDPYQWLEEYTDETDKWTSAQEAFTRNLHVSTPPSRIEPPQRYLFDFWSNIFLPLDDPIHFHSVPREFQPIQPPPIPSEIAYLPDYFKPGDEVTSKGVKVTVHARDPPSVRLSIVNFNTNIFSFLGIFHSLRLRKRAESLSSLRVLPAKTSYPPIVSTISPEKMPRIGIRSRMAMTASFIPMGHLHPHSRRVPCSNQVGDNLIIRLVVQTGPLTQNKIIVVQLSQLQ